MVQGEYSFTFSVFLNRGTFYGVREAALKIRWVWPSRDTLPFIPTFQLHHKRFGQLFTAPFRYLKSHLKKSLKVGIGKKILPFVIQPAELYRAWLYPQEWNLIFMPEDWLLMPKIYRTSITGRKVNTIRPARKKIAQAFGIFWANVDKGRRIHRDRRTIPLPF